MAVTESVLGHSFTGHLDSEINYPAEAAILHSQALFQFISMLRFGDSYSYSVRELQN